MSYFKVVLSGTGIKVPSVPEPIIGFYTTRCVKASDAELAIEIAKKSILEEWKDGEYKDSNIGQLPNLEAEEVQKIGFLSRMFSQNPNRGYTFYSQD